MIKHISMFQIRNWMRNFNGFNALRPLCMGNSSPLSSIGIVIGKKSVEWVEIGLVGSKPAIANVMSEPFNGSESGVQAVLQRMQQCMSRVSRVNVVTLLQSQHLLEKRLLLPTGLTMRELEQYVSAQVASLGHGLATEPAFEFCLLSQQNYTGMADTADVHMNGSIAIGKTHAVPWESQACHLVVFRQQERDQCINLFARSGLPLSAIELEHHALARLASNMTDAALLYRSGYTYWLYTSAVEAISHSDCRILPFEQVHAVMEVRDHMAEKVSPEAAETSIVCTLVKKVFPNGGLARLWLAGDPTSTPLMQLERDVQVSVVPFEPTAIGLVCQQWPGGRFVLPLALACRGILNA